MPYRQQKLRETIVRDAIAGTVVFLVALPLCLGVAVASKAKSDIVPDALNVTLIAGVIAGIVGGIVVGLLSGSGSSVSGPAAGLTAVIAMQIANLGSFQGFLVAVVLAGVIQLVLGIARLGMIAEFFPTCVIKGLLAAIGLLLILKQIPHLLGYDRVPEEDFEFFETTGGNTFSSLFATFGSIDVGATIIGLSGLVFLVAFDQIPKLKKSLIPPTLLVVILGVVIDGAFQLLGTHWPLRKEHLVNLPISSSIQDLTSLVMFPDFRVLSNKAVYIAAITVAAVASLETLLNLEAVDKLDPKKRTSPPNRELMAQGCGNIVSGLLGGLPVTSVVVRSSVNLNAGGQTKLSTIVHGLLLLVCVALLPGLLNRIPLASLAAILIVTGYKLVKPAIIKDLWRSGWSQFLPFATTVIAILLTDLLIGIVCGLIVSIAFILRSNLKRPLRRIHEKHVGGEVLHIELANQVSFLNRAVLARTLDEIPAGQHVLIDARGTDYIDPDILQMIRDFEDERAPAHGVRVSLLGFKPHYDQVADRILFADFSSREVRDGLTPEAVLQYLREGNERFANGNRINRDFNRQMNATANGQFPMVAVLSCIDSRAPTELLFDLGVGDVLTVRIAGNVGKDKVVGSLEYAVAVAGVKLVVVMGHSRCGAVGTAVELSSTGKNAYEGTGCSHLDSLVKEIQLSIQSENARQACEGSVTEKQNYVDSVSRKNVLRMIQTIVQRSETIRSRVESKSVAVIGAFYDVSTGRVAFDLPS
ncbi:MAG: SulP family inorganic anion transporter [Gemmataceae bacterium]